MIGVTVTFSYTGDFDRSRVTRVAENARVMSEELRERVTGLYGVAPAIEFVEIAAIVDNSAS
jgi:hypothetical protein